MIQPLSNKVILCKVWLIWYTVTPLKHQQRITHNMWLNGDTRQGEKEKKKKNRMAANQKDNGRLWSEWWHYTHNSLFHLNVGASIALCHILFNPPTFPLGTTEKLWKWTENVHKNRWIAMNI